MPETPPQGRVHVYLAMSLDGFIAGPDDDLSWLHPPAEVPGDPPPPESDALTFEALLANTGVMMMGRRTYDVVTGFDGPWPYGDLPVWVATRKPLTPVQPTVKAVQGTIDTLLDDALRAASGRDVYLDGGDLVRQAVQADRVDLWTLTLAPFLIGGGVRLFGDLVERQALEFTAHHSFGHHMVQIQARRARVGHL